jgi:hypothetical protein
MGWKIWAEREYKNLPCGPLEAISYLIMSSLRSGLVADRYYFIGRRGMGPTTRFRAPSICNYTQG